MYQRRDARRVLNLGERFKTNNSGELQIIGLLDDAYYQVRFISTGYVTKATVDKIKLGKVKDKLLPRVYGVGYIGDGFYSCKNETVLYHRWKKMLARCYSKSFPDYIDCSVCERWLNFQNFVNDAKNLPGYTKDLSGLALDKDTRVVGNKLYSPATCQFITKADNFNYALGRTK